MKLEKMVEQIHKKTYLKELLRVYRRSTHFCLEMDFLERGPAHVMGEEAMSVV